MRVTERESADLASQVESHLADCLARGQAQGTVAYRRVYLTQLVDWLGECGITQARQVTPVILADYLVYLRNRRTDYNRPEPTKLSVKTLTAEVSVLRSFFRHLAERRVLLFSPAENLHLADRSSTLPKAVLTEVEVKALLSAPGRDLLGLRDRAILETLYSTGLRRAELCGLDLYDVDHAGSTVHVRGGKGGRDRFTPIGFTALDAIRLYLQGSRPELLDRQKEPALFVASGTRRRLSVKTLGYLVRKHGEAAGIARRVTPHVLRHTCATHLVRHGADIRLVQGILGHASVATTQIYTRVAVEDLVRVHERHHPRAKLGIA